MKKSVLIAFLGIWIFSSFTLLAAAPVKFHKIKLSLNIAGDKFETLLYATPLETLDSHSSRALIIIPEQSSFREVAAGFGEFSDAGTLQFTLEHLRKKAKIELKIDWKDDQNKKPGYVAEITGSGTLKEETLLITGTAVFEEGTLELK